MLSGDAILFYHAPSASELFSRLKTCDIITGHETGIPIIPAKNPTLESRGLPMVPAFARPADAKETAIICLSAALLFASLAVFALTTER